MIIRQKKMTNCKSIFKENVYLCTQIVKQNLKMMETKTKSLRWLLPLMSALFLLVGLTACSSSNESDGGGDFIRVPGNEGDTWVKDDDIKDADLDLLVELAVKAERMRQEFVLMLSNGGVSDKPFCGADLNTNTGPTIRLMTEILEKQDEYREALERLDGTDILKPTGTRGKLKDMWDIITCGKTEAQREKEIVQKVLNANNVYSNATAQKQLYDFYCSQEPERAKKIGATDAKDFFNKLNNGDLNDYMLNISHIWRDKGIDEADKPGNAVGDYAYTAFTGKAEYMNSAFRVGGKAAVAAGRLYFTAVDNLAGGYGSKIMDFGDAIQNQITRLKLMKKTLEGKPDWQGWNSYLVNNLKGDLKDAITGAIGDDDSFGKDVVDMVAEEILGWIAEQCTSNDNGDGSEEAQQKKEELAKADEIAIINIETDFGSQGKMIIVTDESTGNCHVATPNADGRLTISTTPGNKLITVIKNNGERLTKQIIAIAGANTVTFKTEKAPYIETNPRSITIDGDGSKELAYVLTNCKYVKYRQTSGSDWCKVDMKIYYGKSGQLTPENSVQLTAEAGPNNEGKERNATIVLEGYNDNSSGAKPMVTYNLKVTQLVMNNQKGDASVTPDEIVFPAKGGTEKVSITANGYTKYSYKNIDSKYSSWLSAHNVSGGFIEITAQPNTTGQVRTGEVICYVTNEDNPTEEQKYLLPVKITQEAEASQPTNSIHSVEFKFNTKTQESLELTGFDSGYLAFTTMQDSFDFGYAVTAINGGKNIESNNIEVIQNKNGLHVKCESDYTNLTADELVGVLEFDIDDMSKLDNGTATVSNITFKGVHYGRNELFYYELAPSGLKMEKKMDNRQATWIATSNTGLSFSKYVYRAGANDDSWAHSYLYLNHSENYVNLIVTLSK